MAYFQRETRTGQFGFLRADHVTNLDCWEITARRWRWINLAEIPNNCCHHPKPNERYFRCCLRCSSILRSGGEVASGEP